MKKPALPRPVAGIPTTVKRHTLATEFGLNPLGFSKFIKREDKELRRQRQNKRKRLRK